MTYIRKHIKVVLFDHDDTLVATRRAKWAMHKHIAGNYYNKHLTEDELRLHWGKPLSKMLSLLYGTADIATALEHAHANSTDFPKILHDDTLSTLALIKNSGKKIGVITATTRPNLMYDFKTMRFPSNLFDYTQTEEDTAYHKPDPRVFEPTLNWLKQNKVKTSEVIYVGDGLHDMKAALGAGFDFIGVSTGLITQSEFIKHGVKAINRLSDLHN